MKKKTDENESRFFGFSLGHRNNSDDSEILVFVEAQRIKLMCAEYLHSANKTRVIA